MILDLEKVGAGVQSISGDEAIEFHDVYGDEGRIDCHVDVDIRKIGETYYIHVQSRGGFATACHRCLDETTLALETSFDLVVKHLPGPGEEKSEDGADEFVLLPRGVNELSLDQHIYENLIVEIPMQILCSPDCKGLCAGCGANLNREACRCAPEKDARWSALDKLKKNTSD
jgi:uncharacterized protein